jgi:hypothetical protein
LSIIFGEGENKKDRKSLTEEKNDGIIELILNEVKA